MERLIDLWIKSLSKTKSHRTLITYKTCVSTLQNYVGKEEVLDIDPKVLYAYADASELSPSSLLTHLSAIKHFYKFAFRRGWLSKENYSEIESVIEDIREELSSTRPQKAPKALTKEEVKRILECVKNTKYERVYSLLLYSGIRLSEYAQLKKEYFQRDENSIYWLRLPAEVTKRNRERLVPIIGPSREETLNINQNLQHWLEDYERNIRVKAGSLQVFTNRLSQRIKVPFSLHSFRHTYITNLVNAGFPAEVVKEFAGHSNVKTTIDIYYRFNQERARSLVESFLG